MSVDDAKQFEFLRNYKLDPNKTVKSTHTLSPSLLDNLSLGGNDPFDLKSELYKTLRIPQSCYTNDLNVPKKSSAENLSLSQTWMTRHGGTRSSVSSKLQKCSYKKRESFIKIPLDLRWVKFKMARQSDNRTSLQNTKNIKEIKV